MTLLHLLAVLLKLVVSGDHFGALTLLCFRCLVTEDVELDWTVVDQADGHVRAKNAAGEIRTFTHAHYKLFDVCESRALPVAIGDELFARSANRRGELINGTKLTVTGWDEHGNPIADGRPVEHRNLCHAYASTSRKVQGSAATRIITGFDRHSVKAATKEVPYVINGRGREFCEIYVESIADLSQIQNRSGDRKFASEMGLLAALSEVKQKMAQGDDRSLDKTVKQEPASTPNVKKTPAGHYRQTSFDSSFKTLAHSCNSKSSQPYARKICLRNVALSC
jgi:hypothetical protein